MAPLRNVGRLRAPIFADCRAFGRDFIGFIGRRDEYEGHRSSTGDRAEHDARGIAPAGPRYVGVEGTAARHPICGLNPTKIRGEESELPQRWAAG